MICNVAIEYPYQLNTIDFRREVAEPMAKHGAWQIVRSIVDEDGFDNSIVIPDDPYECVKLAPLAKQVIMKAIADRLKDIFVRDLVEYVCQFSQAERIGGIPGDVMNNTPVKLRAISDKNERLQFVFSADLNLVYKDQDIWQNVKVDINYIKLPEKD